MKKIMALLLSVMLVLTLMAGCSKTTRRTMTRPATPP